MFFGHVNRMKLYWNYEQVFPLTNSGKAHVTHNLYTCTKLKLCQSCLQVNSLQIEYNHFLTLGRCSCSQLDQVPAKSIISKMVGQNPALADTGKKCRFRLNRQVFVVPASSSARQGTWSKLRISVKVEFPSRETKTRCWLNQTIWKDMLLKLDYWLFHPKIWVNTNTQSLNPPT